MSGDQYRIADQHATYFCTFTVIHWIDLFSRKEYKDIIVNSLNYCVKEKGLELMSWVIMSNHMHIIANTKSPHRFSDFLRDFKKFTSKAFILEMERINESRKDWLLDKFSFEAKRTRRADYFKVWQDSNHAIEMDGSIDLDEKINYIHDNPVRAGLVREQEHYLYSSARDYAGGEGMVDVIAY